MCKARPQEEEGPEKDSQPGFGQWYPLLQPVWPRGAIEPTWFQETHRRKGSSQRVQIWKASESGALRIPEEAVDPIQMAWIS